MKTISKIVITGGPCAGKSTAMTWIQNNFSKLGYTVLFVPETATELITGGVAPWTCGTILDYQRAQMKLQREKEHIFMEAAKTMKAEKILIVCDRGIMDNKAYMTDEEFQSILRENSYNEVELRDEYDAVFHLVTAANGASQFYTTANNSARTENIEQAIEIDSKLINSWTGHPHFRVIDNSTDFENKMFNLMREIKSFLGEPEPYEIERKFLIVYPDINVLESIPNCQKVEIIQTYLNSNSSDEIRIRQRGMNGSFMYYKTIKRTFSGMKRIEIEKRITREEYISSLLDADTTKRQIRKTRYCLTYNNTYFEIDVYPFWDDKAILEVELSDENESMSIPEFLSVIKEVTDDISYKNSELAKCQ